MYRLIGALVLLGAPLLWAAEEAKPLPPAEAAKKLNERVTVEMEVKKVGKTKAGDMYFLNSEDDYRSPKNFTIVLRKGALDKLKEEKIDPTTQYTGKTVRATGTVKTYNERPEIIVEDLTLLKIVEKKEK
jgi:DNA/RNA endonuclease YhcR with UshA esterase domain